MHIHISKILNSMNLMAQLFSSIEVMTNLLFPYFLLLLLPLIFFILKHFKLSLSSKSTPPLPPGPFLWTFLGNKHHHITLAKLAQTYGPLMRIKIGTHNMIVGSSKTAAMEILKTHDRVLSGRYIPHASPAKTDQTNYQTTSLASECNKDWRTTRTTYQSQLFTSRSIESQAIVREKKAMEMVKFAAEMEDKALKLRDLVFATILSILSNILVSRELVRFDQECVNSKVNATMRELLESTTANNISEYIPMLGGFDLQGRRKKSIEIIGRMRSFWGEIVRDRREEKKSTHKDVLDTLINEGCSDNQIDLIFLELFTAGSDTSTITIEWTMAELIKNPNIMKKLQQELDAHVKVNDEIKESKLDGLTYLQACIKETLRLHPTSPLLIPRRATDTCQVMNYTIPKDSQVAVNLWAIGRDPEYWEDPLVYKPERFLGSKIDFKGNHFEYFPFGSGRRICPGIPMAVKQVPLILACLIRLFDWSLPTGSDPDNLDMSERYGFSVIKEQPLILIPKVRK